MRKRLRERIANAAQALSHSPIDENVLDEAFERFVSTGELPEDQRLAEAVTDRALRPPRADDRRSFAEALADLRRLAAELNEPESIRIEPKLPQVREQLFHEAVHGPEPIRNFARVALMACAGAGFDLTDPELLADEALPEYGSVGMHLLGFPERLVQRP